MKQYCRYCVNLCVNNVPYCEEHKQCLSRSYCTHPNNCKDFVFADVEPEFQDAFGETNGYHPRKPRELKKKQCDGQISLFESEEISDTNLKMWKEIFKAESEVKE